MKVNSLLRPVSAGGIKVGKGRTETIPYLSVGIYEHSHGQRFAGKPKSLSRTLPDP